jgi:ABC-type ATPase involved in cell division
MVHSPEILLLDEPTAFQDDDHAHVLMGLIHAYAGGGACVVVSSHDRRVRSDSRYGRRYRLDGGVLKGAE